MKKRPANFHSLLHSADLLEKRLTLLLEPFGIRPRQARILNALNRMGATSQSVLASEFGVTAGSMSTMIDRLLRRKLITRFRDPDDRRIDVLELTDAGRAMLKDIRGVWQDVDDVVVKAMGVQKAAQLTGLTRELKHALGGHVPGHGMQRRKKRRMYAHKINEDTKS